VNSLDESKYTNGFSLSFPLLTLKAKLTQTESKKENFIFSRSQWISCIFILLNSKKKG